jgi:hypothetical protein
MEKDREFPEWIVTKALAGYLDVDKCSALYAERMDWLFGLKAQTASGEKLPIWKLCGFNWKEAADGGAEKSLASDNMKKISAEDFKLFRSAFADFAFWTSNRDMRRERLSLSVSETAFRQSATSITY